MDWGRIAALFVEQVLGRAPFWYCLTAIICANVIGGAIGKAALRLDDLAWTVMRYQRRIRRDQRAIASAIGIRLKKATSEETGA